ncbi:MAG: sugar ABC transporter ATP-binding protein [Paracoccaceae bacterium]
MAAPVFELNGITKEFPGIKALDDVTFDCQAGEVHALVGENGAGKSTLIKVLSGVYLPDAGAVLLDGTARRFTHPLQSLAAGISVIYQEFSLLPDRTVAQNIFLGRELSKWGMLDHARMQNETNRVLAMFGDRHRFDADTQVSDLAVGEQQMVEIAKAISLDAQVIVMDEPTAALNDHESELLFDVVDQLRNQGRSVVYITHRMHEIRRLADRVTVLKDGQIAASFDHVPEPDVIIHAMVGRALDDFYPEAAKDDETGEPVITVQGGDNAKLHDINLKLRAGEITGFAGIQGAGRTALALALFGVEPFRDGTVTMSSVPALFASPRQAVRAGVVMLPGDRKSEGLSLMQSVRDNGMLSARAFSRMTGSPRSSEHASIADMDKSFQDLDIRAANLDVEIQSLSGGNQQKAIVARWLALNPKVLIFVEPTRGIDVNTKASIYARMRSLARGGAAVMVISSDLPEVLGVSDRIMVMRDGRIVAEMDRGATEAEVMAAATGEDLRGAAA